MAPKARPAVQIERLQLRQGPPAELPLGVPIRVSLELTDDMGRRVTVQSPLQVTATAHGANGSPSPYEVRVSNADESSGALHDKNQESNPGFKPGVSGCAVSITVIPTRHQCDEEESDSITSEDASDGEAAVAASPETFLTFCASSKYNSSGRVALGMPHTILPASAGPCKVIGMRGGPSCSKPSDESLWPAAERMRFFSFGESNDPDHDEACPLQISEDSRAHGHGTSHTWGTAWDSGIVLGACVARFLKAMARDPDEQPWSDFRVVELGCGGGVAGLALAASLGAKTVLTDGEPGALQLTEKNIYINGLGDVASTSMLLWGDASQAADLQPPVDVVLAADVAYKEELFQPLAESLLALSGRRTMVLLSFRRRTGGVKAFFDILERDFSVEPVSEAYYDPILRSMDIVVFQLQRLTGGLVEGTCPSSSAGKGDAVVELPDDAITDVQPLCSKSLPSVPEGVILQTRDRGSITVAIPLPEQCSASQVDLEVVSKKIAAMCRDLINVPEDTVC